MLCVYAPDCTARKDNPDLKIIKYIPPKLWAWGAWRAKKLRNVYNLILASLPFEVSFFAKYGVKTKFVGHTVTERVPSYDAAVRKNLQMFMICKQIERIFYYYQEAEGLKIETLLPLFLSVAKKRPDFHYILPIAQGREHLVRSLLNKHNMHDEMTIITNEDDRFQAFHFAYAALAASGTVSLEFDDDKHPCYYCLLKCLG